ncbi:MAG: UDP-3-O-[3-hydroxymyristoyl] N-acetylglucosamine deacetylase [Syntrophobacterales bacterium CG_4_8_14_3_um_filter_49_14]|nr:MAG: UDP-3-O-[3-hydroxymyristoyl] N-acetylglucosamine deacetylase [Syntrophobacterales bacterium CG23_combo_of_CG06-09_8_20_14_all_48_27]PJA47849.1 MAG: UDP-3-O-[3-hydroxymyristoyl] N-acetylglucosamine deacetylase [Syntrophobacterales bacterium CG_4_9_14_3_um_filter_49_8]PJC73305.1 MAG: UDP-3-O-[3-hydroxymyristoyl] N-acetylglucosamine deacetylase [Syntrophobacterales bacterium CG_4_8_14_3_um_filter_49_14]
MCFQKTIREEISCRSVGLHSGRRINMTIKPARVDEGIVFIRKDLPSNNRIKATLENVSDTTLATTIGINGLKASTVEHLLSAFSGMGIDNAVVEIDGHEVPAMDGSALPFVAMLKNVGMEVQDKYRKWLVIKKKVHISDGVGTATFLPSPEFQITYKIDFEHPLIGQQSYQITFSEITYEREICAARTFGFLRDVEYLQAKGLALGGSLQNAVVLDNSKVINKEGLRCPDEFVKHKILDAVGDLSLLGMPIIGHFVAYKSGHTLNNLLLKELLTHRENWRIINFPRGSLNSLYGEEFFNQQIQM